MNFPETDAQARRRQNRRLVSVAMLLAALPLGYTAWVNTTGTYGERVCHGQAAITNTNIRTILPFCLRPDFIGGIR